MAIKKESLVSLLMKTGIAADEAKAKELIEATEEQEVSIPETTKVFTGEAFSKATENLKREASKAAKEIAIKELKEKAGLEFEGKDPDKFIEEFKSHVAKEAGQSVDEKVKSRDKTINDLKDALSKVTGERDTIVKEKSQLLKDQQLLKHLPKNRDERFNDSQYLTLLKSEYEFGEEDGKAVVKKNGEVVKDDQFNPVGYDTIISQHFTQNKWIKEEGGQGGNGGNGGPAGRGGGNQGGGNPATFASMNDFKAHLEKNGIHPGSEQATKLLNQALKDNPEMSMN